MLRAKRVLSKDWDSSAGYIYANGCSHTDGTLSALPNKYDAYPFVLGELLGLNTISSASSASSNQRIYRSTIDFFSDAEIIPEIAVIQWTGIDRFETPNNLNTLPNHVHASKQILTSIGIDDNHEGWYQHLPSIIFDRNRANINIPFRKFYREAIYPEHSKSDSTRSKLEAAIAAKILGLDSYLKSLGVRVIHLIWDGFNKNEINPTLQTMLDTVETLTDDPYEALVNIIDSHGYQACRYHYMADAHHQIATWLYAYIQYGIKIQISEGYSNKRDPIIHHYDLGN
jgi:hypothetical protein